MSTHDFLSVKSDALSGQNILITGAAGRIGSAVAKQVLSLGANVVLADISLQALEELVSSVAIPSSNRIYTFVADVSSAEGIDLLVSEACASVGNIDGAVHSAYPRSIGWGAKFEDIHADNLFQDLNMQLGGAILFSQRIFRCFRDQGYGNLIHLSSIQGVQAPKFDHYAGTSMTSPIEYAAIKSGIISIVRWLAKYSSNQNIRVNCVSPGGILGNQPEQFLRRYRESCTNIGMLKAEQVASTVAFLLLPCSFAINGQNIVVDDGWTL